MVQTTKSEQLIQELDDIKETINRGNMFCSEGLLFQALLLNAEITFAELKTIYNSFEKMTFEHYVKHFLIKDIDKELQLYERIKQ